MGQPVLNGGYYYSPSGTPYTYQNGVAMFTSDTGQHALGLLQQIPAKGGAGAHSGSPFPLIYGPAGHAAMFLPNGHTAAQAAAVASVTQQQLQLQTAAATAAHINGVAAAQSQVSEYSDLHLLVVRFWASSVEICTHWRANEMENYLKVENKFKLCRIAVMMGNRNILLNRFYMEGNAKI